MHYYKTPMIIRRNQLKAVVGLSPSTVDRLEASGDFPRRCRWSAGVVGWRWNEVAAWVDRRGESIKR